MTNAWHDVALAQDVPVGTLQKVEVEGKTVCVGRAAGGWVAFQDECTHEECSLADGELDGSVIVCPCHSSEFDLRTGDVLNPPALDPLPSCHPGATRSTTPPRTRPSTTGWRRSTRTSWTREQVTRWCRRETTRREESKMTNA